MSCKIIKSGILFSRHSHSSDGLTSYCKKCERKRQKLYIEKIAKTENKIVPKEKKCYVCKTTKKTNEFHKNKNSMDGINNKCKNCSSIHNKKYKKTYKDKPPKEKLINNIRSRIKKLILRKTANTKTLLGCSVEYLMKHLEERFYPNPETGEQMTWENKGLYGWHIDHIIPLSSFNLSDPDQLKKACHYTNLQPLWAKDNYEKGR